MAPPGSFESWIGPPRTALLIIDMQVDFASPDGALGRAGTNLDSVPAALDVASRLAHGARQAGVAIVFVRLETCPETDSPAWAERILRRGGQPDRELALCRSGTSGANFHGPVPGEGDLVIAKSRYSSFFNTDLDASLRARNVDTLVVSGIATDCCVDCTARDAFHLDYHVFLVAEGCASYDEAAHEAAVASLERNCATIVRAADVLRAWTNAGT